MNYYPFDSRNPLYTNIIGAMASGETLRLRLLLHKDAKCYSAYVCLQRDGETPWEIKLEPREWIEDYQFFDCEVELGEGLYWYYFRYESVYGHFFVTKTETSLGIVSQDSNVTRWQKTVYENDFTTPDWLSGGIIYQIFPDRFYSSGGEKENVPEDRFIVTDVKKQPEHKQNNGPCSLGNDYYCGDLKGIEQKLSYIKSLGVNCIYLNPIFEAHSNHRYNTADYMKIDPLLGTEEDFINLCKAAEKKGIAIILDGVFSHTGDDSIYFNKYRRYGDDGAFNNRNGEYSSWYSFGNYDCGYSAWWGVPSLPQVNEDDASFTEFITGENGVVKKWLKLGAKGFRLDVADELPDAFLDNLRVSLKAENPDNFLLGEVWEDATNKISYGTRRRFLRGKQLDSVMNYPFCNAIIDFVCTGNASRLNNIVLDILENYPKCIVKVLMNHIGTHDTARIVNRLAKYNQFIGDRQWQSENGLSDYEYNNALELLKLAAVIQYTLPGVPSLYYGDEAGMQGFFDPFCRGFYPWGEENKELLKFYKDLGNFRINSKAFSGTEYIPVLAEQGVIVYIRKMGDSRCLVAVNVSGQTKEIKLPNELECFKKCFGKQPQNAVISLNNREFSIINN